MPANLPPHYFEVEKKLKASTDPSEKVVLMEELLSIIPKHKGTEKLQAMYKTKIAKMRNAAQKKSATAKHGPTHGIKRSGAGQVILVGAPNVGKSSLIQALTNAAPAVSSSPFTTHNASPGMMKYENIQIQLVDTPPITSDYMEVWLADLLKTSDALLFIVDLDALDPAEGMFSVMEKLNEKRIFCIPHDGEPINGPEFHKKTLMIANKSDSAKAGEAIEEIKEFLEVDLDIINVSTTGGAGLDELRRRVFDMLQVIRVYSKVPGKKPEMDDPFTLKKGATVMGMARTVHKDFSEKLQFARIWNATQYQGQRVNRNHVLEDEDIIELHL